jgi:predicted alpha/beta superfamily hydrolase
MPETAAPPTPPSEWQPYPAREGHTVVGDLRVLPDVAGPREEDRRELIVYLPPSYGGSDHRYPVIYMQDGQNLFDEITAFGEEWRVDDTMEDHARNGLEAIVVGVPNAGERRIAEYGPFEDPEHGGGEANAYLDFLVGTVKARIDADFRTRPEREHTLIAGSSMGGLLSLYAFFYRAETFGGAAVMSPSLWFADRAVLPFVEAAAFTPGRVYLDVGTEEGEDTLTDVIYLRALLRRKGYLPPHGLRYVEQPGAGHAETEWRQRFHDAVPFLLGAL